MLPRRTALLFACAALLPADPRAAACFAAAEFWSGQPEPLPGFANWHFDEAAVAGDGKVETVWSQLALLRPRDGR